MKAAPRAVPIYITWLNYLGGFEYFLFTAQKEFQMEIEESGQTTQNIFPNWPNSYGQNADTIDKTTFRKSRNKIIVRSQHLTANQRDALKFIKSSPVVQIVTTRSDRRTVLVDTDSFKIYDESERTYTISFTISFTDNIPSQRI